MKNSATKYAIVVSIIALFIFLILATDVILYPELYSTTVKSFLRKDLNNNDALATEYYLNTYISRGNILFNGLISRKLWQEYWGEEKPFPKQTMTIFNRH